MFWILVAGLLIAGWAVWAYNGLIALGRRADGAWADIDAQLKRRHDLVPALVETVKGYADHESETLVEVVQRRGAAVDSPAGPGTGTAAAEAGLAGALRGLFALAESYPELRASQRFGMLQEQLAEIEDALQSARRYYNAVVRDFNTRIAQLPDALVARPAGFAARPFFELDDVVERSAPRLRLGR